MTTREHPQACSVLVMGVGAFAHSTCQILKDAGAHISTYLTRTYGHYPPALVGPIYRPDQFSSPGLLLKEKPVDLVVPMSIDWAQAPWAQEFLDLGVPVFCPTRDGMKIERDRDFARQLCHEFKIPFPEAYVASNRLEPDAILNRHPQPFVLTNPICSPTTPSPPHIAQ